MNTDYQALELLILNFIAKGISLGRTSDIEALGIDLATMQIVAKMDVDELAIMARTKSAKIIRSISIDKKALRVVAAQANKTGAQKNVIKRLIQAKANHSLLSYFFSLTKAEVATLRKIHNVEVVGRPRGVRRLDATARVLVLDRLTGFVDGFGVVDAHNPMYQAQAILDTAELTQFSVADIWRTARVAERDSRFSWSGSYGNGKKQPRPMKQRSQTTKRY